jgi:hypothetical protein
VAEEQRDRGSPSLLRRHPVVSAVLLGCTLAGALAGAWWLSGDWSLARRVAAGAVGGAGVGLLVTATRLY